MDLHSIKTLIRKHPNQHYVYLLKRPNGIPFYVGKGGYCRAFRIETHIREGLEKRIGSNRHKVNLIKKILENGRQIEYEIIGFFSNEQDALQNEKENILKYGRVDNGTGILTNLTDGGDGASNPSKIIREKIGRARRGKTYNISQETREKISKAQKGKKLSEDHKRKIGETSRGRIHSEESRKKMSERLQGHFTSEETKKKISEANKGRIVSDEHRRRLSESGKGKHDRELGRRNTLALWQNPEYRARMSELHKGKRLSEEAKRKISEANKGRIISEETRRKIGEANKGKLTGCPNMFWRGRKHSEETRQKQRLAKLGKKSSLETKKKASESITIWWEKRRHDNYNPRTLRILQPSMRTLSESFSQADKRSDVIRNCIEGFKEVPPQMDGLV